VRERERTTHVKAKLNGPSSLQLNRLTHRSNSSLSYVRRASASLSFPLSLSFPFFFFFFFFCRVVRFSFSFCLFSFSFVCNLEVEFIAACSYALPRCHPVIISGFLHSHQRSSPPRVWCTPHRLFCSFFPSLVNWISIIDTSLFLHMENSGSSSF